MQGLNTAIAWLLPFLPLWFLISVRFGVALGTMPAPLGTGAPAQVRVIIGLVLALAVALPHAHLAPALPEDPWWLGAATFGEVLVGIMIGLTVRCVLASMTVAGSFMAFSTGLAFAQSVDPTMGENSTPVARGLALLGVALFFAFQGHHALIGALAGSVQVAPPGDVYALVAQDGIVHIGSSMIREGLQIAAPVVATMFVVQIGMALAARAAPRVQIFQMTFAIAVTAGLIALFVSMPSVVPTMLRQLRGLPSTLADLLAVH